MPTFSSMIFYILTFSVHLYYTKLTLNTSGMFSFRINLLVFPINKRSISNQNLSDQRAALLHCFIDMTAYKTRDSELESSLLQIPDTGQQPQLIKSHPVCSIQERDSLFQSALVDYITSKTQRKEHSQWLHMLEANLIT